MIRSYSWMDVYGHRGTGTVVPVAFRAGGGPLGPMCFLSIRGAFH